MAAESPSEAGPRTQKPRGRRGFALFAAVIIIAVIAVMATVVAVTLSGDNDQARIERAADVLHRLVAAMDTTRTATSFGANVTEYPGKLSQLTHKISGVSGTTDKGCNGVVITGTLAGKWKGPYYLVPIPTTGYPIAPGFFANDQIVKVATSDIYIQMNNVALHDAQGLELFVEKRLSGAGPIVIFSSTDPTTVQYHLNPANTSWC
jgi:type II secretory pathway pseudopilin PulG